MSRKLGIDLDGCLCNFTDSYSVILTRHTGITFPPASPEWPLVWYWDRMAGITSQQEKAAWDDITAPHSMFWAKLAPLDGARDVLTMLGRLELNGHEVYFITARPGYAAKFDTSTWLWNHGMPYPSVILSDNKIPLIRDIGLDFYVDDKPSTIEQLAQAARYNRDVIDGHIYLKDAPYNKDCTLYNATRVASVKEALELEGLWLD